jgi:transposase-like protein
MSKLRYSAEQVQALRVNPNVKKCSDKSVTYSSDFKIRAIKAWLEEGQGPNTIFTRAGFDLEALGKWRPEACLKLWRKIYKAQGEAGLLGEKRGKAKKKKPKIDETDVEYLQTKIVYLEAENNFLRNLKTNTKN